MYIHMLRSKMFAAYDKITYIRACMHTYIHAYKGANIYVHVCVHVTMHIHAYIRMCIETRCQKELQFCRINHQWL